MQQAGHHHVNILAQELSTQIQEQLAKRNNQLLLVIQLLSGLNQALFSSDSKDYSFEYSANSVSTDNN